MHSDEMARNARILKPFDSYGIVGNDSTKLPYVDTVNFVGPQRKEEVRNRLLIKDKE